MTKRFMLFAGKTYFPEGGARDLRASYDSIEEAKNNMPRALEDLTSGNYWWQIYDLEARMIVAEFKE